MWWGKDFVGRAAADVYVLPEARRRGVGRALFETLVDETRAHGLPGVKAEMPDDDPASLATALSWECSEVGHHRESVLDLATIDDALDLRPAAPDLDRRSGRGRGERPDALLGLERLLP
jgi:hypothetical protein